jgi:N-acetylmuramoyl-L-alanine amidase
MLAGRFPRPVPRCALPNGLPGSLRDLRGRAALLAGLALLAACVLLAAPPARGQEIESRYQLAVTQFYQVQHDPSGPPEERADRWRAVAQTFQRIHRDAPESRRGGDAAFSAAISLREAWLVTGARTDASDAIAAFGHFTAEHPESPLADDAWMHQAALLEAQPQGAQAAYEAYRKVAARTPPGPQAALARSRLNALLREQSTGGDAPDARRPGASAALTLSGAPQAPAAASANASAANAPASGAASRARPGARSEHGGPVQIRRVQVLSALQFTRIIVTTSRPVKPKVEQAAGAQAQLRLDFKHTREAPGLALPALPEGGVLKRAAFTPLAGQGTRFALDVGPLERYETKTFELPVETKLVVDLYPLRNAAAPAGAKGPARKRGTAPAAGHAAVTQAAPRPTRPSETPPAAALPAADSGLADADRLSMKASLGLKVRTVMLDPGHGGHDPGAIAFGVQEKDLALEIAKRLRALIQQRHPDVRVGMTREDDRFIPLARRPKLAKAFGADLFVSIHLNASPAERLQGVETYFLNLTSDASALAVAARENATTEKRVSDLNVILLDLLRDTNILESSKLAQALHTELVDSLKESHPVRDLGVKQAPFMVLIGAEMPSVLVEAGFVTNRGESDRLKSASYIDRIAGGIYAGLDKYMAGEEIVQAAPRSRLLTKVAD